MSDDRLSGIGKALPLRTRADLVFKPLRFGGQAYWSVKDPLTLRYYQLRGEEYFLLKLLSGRISFDELKARFHREFAPRRLDDRQLEGFLASLHRQGLIVADTAGQGEQLLVRRGLIRRQELLQSFSSILAIRLRGVDPERFLRWLYPKCRWLFSTWCVAGCVLLVLAALTLITVQYETVLTKLPTFYAFFSLGNLLWIAVAIAVAKVLHELGHALACKHYGGECHEMGLMLLVFTPVLYCNVSDAWMMPNKWHRIVISAAGMYVEVVLAAVCTFLWWFSEPGLLNTICLNIMFVCSISTVLFNGNPLLRYDGYYILADALEVPNMRQQSVAVVQRALARWLLGIEMLSDRMLPARRRWLLAAYAIAAVIYRFIVVILILWFLHEALTPYGLQSVVQVMALLVIGGMIVVPLWRAARYFSHPGRRSEVRWLRLLACTAVACAVVAVAWFVQLPHRIAAPAIVQPQDARRVYVSVPGKLTSAVQAGARVEEGQTLATLENLDVEKEIVELTWQQKQLEKRLDGLNARRVTDPSAADRIPTAAEALRDVQTRLARRIEDRQRLTLIAPASGTVLPPPRFAPRNESDQLATWSGSPLDDSSRCGYLETGTMLCRVGDARRMEVLLIVDQQDVEYVRRGQRVHLIFDQLQGITLWGIVDEVSTLDAEDVPAALIAKREVPVTEDNSGTPQPIGAVYQARVLLDDHPHQLIIGGTGRAKIHVPSRSLGQRFRRYLNQTFRFSL